MVKRSYCEHIVESIIRHIDKLTAIGCPALLCYGSQDRLLQYYGSTCIKDVIDRHNNEVFEHPEWNTDVAPTSSAKFLPPPNLVEMMNYNECKGLVICLVRASVGDAGYIGWGKPERKPQWWPGTIPWTKHGVQRGGLTKEQLRTVISAGYVFQNEQNYEKHVSDTTAPESMDSSTLMSEYQTEWVDIKPELEDNGDHDYPVTVLPDEVRDSTEINEQPECSDDNDPPASAAFPPPPTPLLAPPPSPSLVSRMNYKNSKRAVISLMKASAGLSGFIGWGRPERKPQWWPDTVPWTKHGVQRGGLTVIQLRTIINAYYAFEHQHNYDTNMSDGTAFSESIDHSSLMKRWETSWVGIKQESQENNGYPVTILPAEYRDSSEMCGQPECSDDNALAASAAFPPPLALSPPLLAPPSLVDKTNYKDSRRRLQMDKQPEYDDDNAPAASAAFHPPPLPPPNLMDRMTYKDAKRAVITIMKSYSAPSGHVGWGRPERKPQWWPYTVPWTKHGVQRAGLTVVHLKTIIYAYYAFQQQENRETKSLHAPVVMQNEEHRPLVDTGQAVNEDTNPGFLHCKDYYDPVTNLPVHYKSYVDDNTGEHEVSSVIIDTNHTTMPVEIKQEIKMENSTCDEIASPGEINSTLSELALNLKPDIRKDCNGVLNEHFQDMRKVARDDVLVKDSDLCVKSEWSRDVVNKEVQGRQTVMVSALTETSGSWADGGPNAICNESRSVSNESSGKSELQVLQPNAFTSHLMTQSAEKTQIKKT